MPCPKFGLLEQHQERLLFAGDCVLFGPLVSAARESAGPPRVPIGSVLYSCDIGAAPRESARGHRRRSWSRDCAPRGRCRRRGYSEALRAQRGLPHARTAYDKDPKELSAVPAMRFRLLKHEANPLVIHLVLRQRVSEKKRERLVLTAL
jgi:hypothetical protein